MKKTEIRGWKDVFSFTVTQTIKSKAYIITLVIMCVLVLLSMPVMNLVMSAPAEEDIEKSAIEKVYPAKSDILGYGILKQCIILKDYAKTAPKLLNGDGLYWPSINIDRSFCRVIKAQKQADHRRFS